MNITYNSVEVTGQRLNKDITKNEPEVIIKEPKDNNLYSIIMIDTDAPVGKKDNNISFLHWWVANIDLDTNFNQVWFTYFPPTPPKNTGAHHYRFYLLKQLGLIVKSIGMDAVTSRAPFYFNYYIKAFQLSIVDSKYFIINS